MHVAYYILREDGDGELFVVLPVNDEFFSHPEFANELQQVIENGLSKIGYWFKVGYTECDFPDIWDLSSISSRDYILHD